MDTVVIKDVAQSYIVDRAGRKTKCTPDLIDDLALLITDGLTVRDACAIVEITNSTYQNWYNRGKKEWERLEQTFDTWSNEDIEPSEAIFLLFFVTLKKAIPARKRKLINQIRLAGQDPKTWQANAWLLERLHPNEYGRKTRVEVHDWRSELIQLIKNGQVEFEVLESELGTEDAERLFITAGMGSVSSGKSE